jgi:hypothetical protein
MLGKAVGLREGAACAASTLWLRVARVPF